VIKSYATMVICFVNLTSFTVKVINWLRVLLFMVKALVLYHSQQYGNTEKMAKAVAEGLTGCEVTLHNTNTERYPIEEYAAFDVVAFGSPDYFSYMAGTLKTFLDDWYLHRNKPGYKGKPYGLFMSHGGGGRAKESMDLFHHLGTQVGSIVISSGSPSESVLRQCRELGELLAKSL
jgi:multimeric flavodoxin WrbA